MQSAISLNEQEADMMHGETPSKPRLAAAAEERRQRVKVLQEAIRKHNRSYFEEDNPRIADAQYDEMVRELEMLEAHSPELRTVDSPLHEVGGSPSGNFSAVEHNSPMLSLANAFNDEELAGFVQSVRKKLSPDDAEKSVAYTGELKVDGLALSLIYLDRRLVRAVTRGDGKTGENVTTNAEEVHDLPLTLEARCPASEIEIRGEVYMPWQNFESLNARAHQNGEKTYANPRNAAAGSMRQLKTGVVEARGLHFIAYTALAEPGLLPAGHYDTMRWLSELGFTPSPHLRRLTSLEACTAYYRELLKKRSAIQFDVDGVVFKVDRQDQQQLLGQRGRSPRWAIACKFPAARVQTKVLDVHFQVGRLGTLTPVAEVVPVFVAGVTVSKVSLHNMAIIRKLGLRIGDTVEVKRSGDVIPQITKVIKSCQENSRAVVFPQECPGCHGKVSLTADNKRARCENGVACAAQQKNAIVHFCSRRAMNMKGLGSKLVHQLVESDLVASASELYLLTLKALCSLDRVAEKRARQILEAVWKDTKPPLNLFIYALGIPTVGEETAKILARFFPDIDALTGAEQSELNKLPGIGPETADHIVRYFAEEHSATVLKQLLKHVHPQPVLRKGGLAGNSYVLTGQLAMPRQEATKQLEMHGATVSASVTTVTTALIAGNRPGRNKTDKARKLGTAIMDENAFNTLLAKTAENKEKQVSEVQKSQNHLPDF